MGLFDKVVKSVVGGAAKAVGGSKVFGTSLDPLSIGTSIASDYAMRKYGSSGGGRGKVGRSPEVKTARIEKREMVQQAKPMGPAAVKTARQEGRAGVLAARDVARERIQQERADKRAAKTAGTKLFKDGGSVMKKKDMMDMEGRALKRKTADAKGRAMKKPAKAPMMPMGMKKGGAAKKKMKKGC